MLIDYKCLIIGLIILLILFIIIYVLYGFMKVQSENFTSNLNQYPWIISWIPSTGTPPINYYYNITTDDNKPFLKGKTKGTKLNLTGASNFSSYNVSLYAQNNYGKSEPINKKIKTFGPSSV